MYLCMTRQRREVRHESIPIQCLQHLRCHEWVVGLNGHANVPTLGQKFTAIFEEVVHDGIAKGLLRELPECPYDADDSGEAAAADGTVH